MPPSVSSPELVPRAAGLAGPMKMVLLALTGVIFLAVGLGIGFLLQQRTLTQSETAQTPADSHSLDNPAADSADVPVDNPAEQTGTAALPSGEDHPDSTSEEPVEDGVAPPAANNLQVSVVTEAPLSESRPWQELPQRTASTRIATSGLGQLLTGQLLTGQPMAGQPMERLAEADKLFMVGNYQGAFEAYSLLASQSANFQTASVRLRLALCEEALGDHKQALADYRSVVELRPALELRDAAILGQARLWSIAGQSELATATLFRSILTSSNPSAVATGAQIPHQLAILLAQRVRPGSDGPQPSEFHQPDHWLLSPTLTMEPFQILEILNAGPLTAPLNQIIPENDISVVEKFSSAPEEIFVNVRTERMTALELIRRVANRTGWKVSLTEDARLRLQEHTVQPDCLNLPLAIVFDAILEPFETIWRTENGALLILLSKHAKAQEIQQYRLQSAQRALRYACRLAPEHRWAAASALELARLTAQTGSMDLAGQYLSKMLEQIPRSEFQPIGWFNLGKVELCQGRLDTALDAFHRAGDLLMGHPLEALSYLYAGRIQMENDRPRDAIPPFTRALVLAAGSKHEPLATLQLASAYLMLEHYQRANEILLEHRARFAHSPLQDQAAFLASLIQYRGTKDKQEKFRAGTSLLGSMTNLETSRCFGGHWQLLAGSTYREFGMAQQEFAILRTILKNSYAYPLQNRARLMLLEDAPDQLTDLQPQLARIPAHGKPSPLYFKTRLKEAETTLQQGNPEVALQLSRELAEHPQVADEDRRAALRLMGRIYQSRGEHELAVQCFSGIIPSSTADQPAPTASLLFPEQGVK